MLSSWEEGRLLGVPSLFVFPDYLGSPPLLSSVAVFGAAGLGGVHCPPFNLLAPAEPGVMRKELGTFL